MSRLVLDARLPPELLVKLRDKLAPKRRLSVRLTDGVIPYDKNDLVAIAVGRGTFERGEIAALLRMLPAVRLFLDVGANLGLYSLLAARRMPSGGQAIAFEASGVEYDKLCWTLRRNGLKNVRAEHAAVSDSVGETTIHESLSGMGALNRLDHAAKSVGVWRQTCVPMTSLDAYDEKFGPLAVDLIKIDVEGHEAPVLEGARQLLVRERPTIMIEMNSARASERSAPERVWDQLSALGYQWYQIADDAGRVIQCSAVGDGINLLAVHSNPRNKDAVARLTSGGNA